MAKSSKSRTYRDASVIASAPLVRPPSSVSSTLLSDISDRRFWSPDPYSARTFSTVGHLLSTPAPKRLVAGPGLKRLVPVSFNRSPVSFEAPSRVLVCVRRHRRREVLHALKLTRSGAGRSRRRNQFSGVSCK